jgi:uncharacterized protein (DUF2384 family)
MASEVAYIAARLAESFTPEEARIWWCAPHPLLDGMRPIDLVQTGGANRVAMMMESLREGTYT